MPDTPVTLWDGSVALVQDLNQGSTVWSLGPAGKPQAAQITAVRRQHTDSYLLVKVGTREVQATVSHRIAVPGGALVRLDTLKAGDKVLVWGLKGVEEAAITSVRVYPANLVSYDLTVEGHRPFLVNGILLGD